MDFGCSIISFRKLQVSIAKRQSLNFKVIFSIKKNLFGKLKTTNILSWTLEKRDWHAYHESWYVDGHQVVGKLEKVVFTMQDLKDVEES
jgi:hypothetical protein